MARATMSDMLATLRGMTNAGTADYSVGTVTYWTDDQLQAALDRNRKEVIRLSVSPLVEYDGGTVSYTRYPTNTMYWEGGTAFELQDSTGAAVGTALYTFEAERGLVTFASTTTGVNYYACGVVFDVDGAAADVWERKAAQAADLFTFSTDNHSIQRGVIIQNYLRMASQYRARSKFAGNTISVERGDT